MLRFRNKVARKPRLPDAPRAAVEPMEGRVLMSAAPIGDTVTFTYVVTNPTTFTPDGRQLVVTYKGGVGG